MVFGTPIGVVFGTKAGGENSGPGPPGKTWAIYLAYGMAVFIAKERSTQTSLVVRGRDGAVAHGDENGWQVVTGSRQSCGWFHGEMAQGRDGKRLVPAYKRGRQEKEREGQRRAGGGAALLMPLSMKT